MKKRLSSNMNINICILSNTTFAFDVLLNIQETKYVINYVNSYW